MAPSHSIGQSHRHLPRGPSRSTTAPSPPRRTVGTYSLQLYTVERRLTRLLDRLTLEVGTQSTQQAARHCTAAGPPGS